MIGDQIKKYRESKGISQNCLAETIGVSRPTLSKIETNKRAIDIETLMLVANTLKVDWRILAAGELVQAEVFFGGSINKLNQATERIIQETAILEKSQKEYEKSHSDKKMRRLKEGLIAVFSILVLLEIMVLIGYHIYYR